MQNPKLKAQGRGCIARCAIFVAAFSSLPACVPASQTPLSIRKFTHCLLHAAQTAGRITRHVIGVPGWGL